MTNGQYVIKLRQELILFIVQSLPSYKQDIKKLHCAVQI